DRGLFTGWMLLEDSHVILEPHQCLKEASALTSPVALQEMLDLQNIFIDEWLSSENSPEWGLLKGLPAPLVRLSPYPHKGSVSIWEKGPYESPEYIYAMEWLNKAGQRLGISNVDFFESGEGTLRILQKGIDKGTGLRMLSERSLIDLNKTVYFGDANNDLAPAQVILEAGGVVVSVANATGALKNISTYTTSGSGGAGVMEVIEML
ncbi:MAG: HAD family hydrolase, partial [Candidatus Roizmanbacteria bacterium]